MPGHLDYVVSDEEEEEGGIDSGTLLVSVLLKVFSQHLPAGGFPLKRRHF